MRGRWRARHLLAATDVADAELELIDAIDVHHFTCGASRRARNDVRPAEGCSGVQEGGSREVLPCIPEYAQQMNSVFA